MSRNQFSTGHVASPYLRRFRLPMLNSYRSFDESISPSEELAKWELITARMNEKMKKDANVNTTPSPQLANLSHDDNNGNEKRKSETKLKTSFSDPFFHPHLLFGGSKP